MGLRLLAFFPPAVLITFVLLLSGSSFVSAVEGSFLSEPNATSTPISIKRYETECDVLHREIHALSHAATSCEEQPPCLGSPLLCPVAMNGEIERDFQRLRAALSERCGVPLGLMDYAWGGPFGEASTCGDAHDWFESAASGLAEPSRYVF